MQSTYKKKSNLINKTGYTPGYATEKNPVNYIPSEDITMANTPYPLRGTPLDENGKPIGKPIVMFPGKDYKFDGASYVEEKPFFQKGGKKIYVESTNNPRYIAYQDSLFLYNKGYDATKDAIKDFGNKNISYDKAVGFTGPIKPSRLITVESDDKKEALYKYPIYEKPQEQVIVQRPDLQAIQNNLQSKGLVYGDLDINADISRLHPDVRRAKYYDIQENINQPFGGSQTNYRTSDLSNITSPDDLGPGNTRKITPRYQKGGKKKINPSLESQLLKKYVTPSTKKALERAKQQGINTGIHNGPLDAIRHSSSAAAMSSILPSWANAIPAVLPLNIAATNIAGAAHEINSTNSFKEHASDLYNNFVGSLVGVLPVSEETKHDMLISAQKNGILSDMGNRKPVTNTTTQTKKNNMNSNVMPNFGHGGEKNDWISAKISKLVKEEGYPQKQAVAIAYEMYDNMHKNGGYQLPKYQVGKKGYSFGNTFAGSNFAKPKFSVDPNMTTTEQFSEQMKKDSEERMGQYLIGKDPNKSDDPFALTAGEDWKKITDERNKAAGIPQDFSKNIFGEASAKEEKTSSNVKPLDVKGEEPFQFFNPYSGFDIPTAASTLGSSIESGDTLGTIGSGLKLATGLARNFLGGMGQERRKNYVTQQGYEKQREAMTGEGKEIALKFGGYYQDGGMEPGMEEGMEQQGGGQEEQIMQQVSQMLQQGADPQQVIQQLVQMGIPQEQAVQIVQAVMQQTQGSTPQLRRGGMMQYQNGVEYEEDEYGDLINKYPNRNPQIEEEYEDEETVKESATSAGIESASEATSFKEETPSYDKNSARDTWVAKTGMPWSEAKKLGYTSGSAKDNTKLLSELNDPRFKKEYLRNKPFSPAKNKPQNINTYGVDTNSDYTTKWREEANRKAQQTNIKPQESVKKVSKPSYVDPYKGLYEDAEGNVRNAKGQISDLQGRPQNFFQRAFVDVGVIPPMGKDGRRMKVPGYESTMEEQNAWHKARGEAKKKRGNYQEGGEYDDYNEKDYKDNDVVRHSGGNTGLTKSEVNSLAKQYKMSPQEFLNIVSYGEPGEGMSSRHELYIEGSDKYLPKNWRDTYKQNKSSTTGVRGVLNRGLDYMGVNPVFNMGGYYQDGGEQQIAQQVAQAMQQGMQPQEAMSTLVESGMTEDQAMQMVQAIMQQIQGQTMQESTPQMRKGGYYQDGGMEQQGGGQEEQIMQQVSQMLQQGAQPEEILQMLVEAGIPEDQAMQMVQAVMQQMQGGQQQAPQGTPQLKCGGSKYQDGGEAMDEQMEGENEGAEGETPSMEQIESQVEEALKQGANPEEILQQLVQMGMPEEQAVQMIQEILQEIQGGETGMESPEEGTPQMQKGGKYMRALVGKTIKSYTYNPKTDSYTVSYE
jgi:hypothetical protein